MSLKNMHLGTKLKELCFRALRLIGVFALIYACMVFYLALTERQKAFPRAITHTEANAAIQGKAKQLTCKLEDGIVLNGWSIGNESDPVLLYFPDAEEDAAQFLAEVESVSSNQLVAFNYRGSGENKGKPSEENFELDANQIAQCAVQINGKAPQTLVGRGTGAILATKQALIYQKYGTKNLILLDPLFSIADAVSEKYRKLYPKFLVRADVSISQEELNNSEITPVIIIDRKQFEQRTLNSVQDMKKRDIQHRNGETLKNMLIKNVILSAFQGDSLTIN
ncbi:MAG: alpha/beta hydrolase [Fibrobacter sp.]|nr:alpha/beta hydrolase [Fibrobacter sp.]